MAVSENKLKRERLAGRVQNMQPAELAQMERFLARRDQGAQTEAVGRDQARVNTLEAAHAKLEARIKNEPDHPKIERWKVLCNQYRQSLINWHRFGQETEPRGKPGVVINVPLGELLGKMGE